MLATEYLLSIEGTEDENKLFESMKYFDQAKEGLSDASRIPVVGKILTALVALSDSNNIAEFKQTSYFEDLEGWDIKVHSEGRGFSVYPGSAMRKKIFTILGITVGAIIGLVILVKFLRRRK